MAYSFKDELQDSKNNNTFNSTKCPEKSKCTLENGKDIIISSDKGKEMGFFFGFKFVKIISMTNFWIIIQDLQLLDPVELHIGLQKILPFLVATNHFWLKLQLPLKEEFKT